MFKKIFTKKNVETGLTALIGIVGGFGLGYGVGRPKEATNDEKKEPKTCFFKKKVKETEETK